ncbi:MAG: hypothetical protein DDG60_07345 [Anaerolineae bacterium]|nr:MAG: hypothetical protein DDG60_07345 [Anaerolineae bacterium]
MPESQTYRPELLSRRGEWNAWLFALSATVGLFMIRAWAIVPSWVWFFVGFLYFSALSISFGNWMDRQTRLMVFADGVAYENGLRRVRLRWEQIQQVRLLSARWGKTVQVLGDTAHFSFNTLGEVKFRGQVRGRTGFVHGQAILEHIIRSAGLLAVTQNESCTIYSRELS